MSRKFVVTHRVSDDSQAREDEMKELVHQLTDEPV